VQLTQSHISMIVLSEHMMLIRAIITENQYSYVQYLKMKLDQGEFHKTESCVMPNRTPTHRRITNKTASHNQTQSTEFPI